jgi:hypothetical protein
MRRIILNFAKLEQFVQELTIYITQIHTTCETLGKFDNMLSGSQGAFLEGLRSQKEVMERAFHYYAERYTKVLNELTQF